VGFRNSVTLRAISFINSIRPQSVSLG